MNTKAHSSAVEPGVSKAELTQQKLLAAGIELFSTNGFEATSTRNVEAHAGVQRNLISYHFGNKEEFWKACVRDLFERAGRNLTPVLDQAKDIEPAERNRFLIRQFVRTSASHPEIMRIMFDEGRRDDWRLAWIVEHFTGSFHATVSRLFDELSEVGAIPALSATRFYYALVSSAAIFAMAPECRLLTGEDPYDEALINDHANAIAQLLVPYGNAKS